MSDERVPGIGFKGFGLDLQLGGWAPIVGLVVLVVILAPAAMTAYLVWREGEAQVTALDKLDSLIRGQHQAVMTEAMLDRCMRVLTPEQIAELQAFGWNPVKLRAKCPWLLGGGLGK